VGHPVEACLALDKSITKKNRILICKIWSTVLQGHVVHTAPDVSQKHMFFSKFLQYSDDNHHFIIASYSSINLSLPLDM
jgi:hypothetical protein